MYLKSKLMKAASICMYVFTALWFVLAASFFALSNNWYWAFAIFALICLYDGFVITSVREKMTSVNLEKKENIKFLVCWILSIVCLPAFILNGIAYFRTQEDELVVIRRNVKEEATAEAEAPKPKKPFYKTKRFITMCVAFGMIIVASFSAMCFETSGFSVKVSDFTLTREMTLSYNEGMINGKQYAIPLTKTDDGKEHETTYSVTMYKPDSATEENPAPVVFVLPGFTRTKATMSQYCIELSRRGAVVFCSDPGGQGSTTENSTGGANGVQYLAQYVYNNTDDFKFCDKSRFGAVGHSAGGGNVGALAEAFSGSTYEESVIKAVYVSGYVRTSLINRFANFRCNAALSYAYYDEGAFRYDTGVQSFETEALAFINDVNGKGTNSYDFNTLVFDYGYGSMADGTYRVIHREKINHCFEMYDKLSITNSVAFFNDALNMNSDIDPDSHIWFGKEFSNGIALASAFTFIIALCGVLMLIPFFATLKNGGKVKAKAIESGVQPEAGGDGEAVEAQPAMQTVVAAKPVAPAEQKRKTVAHKVIFWSCMLLTAIIACLDYIPLAALSVKIFPTGNSASVFTFTFPARMVNAILMWAAINGAVGLAIFFGTTALENLYEYTMYKVKGIQPNYDWSKFGDIKIRGNGWLNVLLNVLKSLLLALIMFGSFYFLVQLSYWIFHQDFRFMLISAAPLNARMFVTALEYMPIIFIFYISNSIRVNCSIGREGWKEWKVLLVSALANSVGLAFILLINYVCYFTTGVPFYGRFDGVEVWLYINMVFGLVVMMFILPIFNRLFYKLTGNVWVGAIACCMIFIMMTISASVSYIPMY